MRRCTPHCIWWVWTVSLEAHRLVLLTLSLRIGEMTILSQDYAASKCILWPYMCVFPCFEMFPVDMFPFMFRITILWYVLFYLYNMVVSVQRHSQMFSIKQKLTLGVNLQSSWVCNVYWSLSYKEDHWDEVIQANLISVTFSFVNIYPCPETTPSPNFLGDCRDMGRLDRCNQYGDNSTRPVRRQGGAITYFTLYLSIPFKPCLHCRPSHCSNQFCF